MPRAGIPTSAIHMAELITGGQCGAAYKYIDWENSIMYSVAVRPTCTPTNGDLDGNTLLFLEAIQLAHVLCPVH